GTIGGPRPLGRASVGDRASGFLDPSDGGRVEGIPPGDQVELQPVEDRSPRPPPKPGDPPHGAAQDRDENAPAPAPRRRIHRDLDRHATRVARQGWAVQHRASKRATAQNRALFARFRRSLTLQNAQNRVAIAGRTGPRRTTPGGPDPTRHGHYLIGIHPEGDTILAGKGARAYAGRTGRLTMSGWHDGTKFP